MVELIDVVLEGFKEVIDWIIGLFLNGLTAGYEALTAEMFGTPTPKTTGSFVFGEPTNGPWPVIRDALVGGEVMLVALLILVICVQGRHTIRIFNVASAYEARKSQKTAWTGALLIITWYWVGVLTLYLVDGFTIALMPSLNTLTKAMLNFLTASLTNPALAFLLALIGGGAMWILQAVFYIREVLLYIFLYAMPVAIAVAFGNVPVLSMVASRFCKKFIPLACAPLPAALLFKGYDLLYAGDAVLNPTTAFLQYLVAVSLPVLTLVVTWKMFRYASPLTTRVLGGAVRGAVTAGAIGVGASVGGPAVASTAARWGPKAAAGHAFAQKVSVRGDGPPRNSTGAHLTNDNVVSNNGNDGVPEYRRAENDPGYY